MNQQENSNVIFLASVIYHIKENEENENKEHQRLLFIASVFILTGLTPIYSVILFPLFSQSVKMLYSLKTIKQKKQFLEQYLK